MAYSLFQDSPHMPRESHTVPLPVGVKDLMGLQSCLPIGEGRGPGNRSALVRETVYRSCSTLLWTEKRNQRKTQERAAKEKRDEQSQVSTTRHVRRS
ncbi:Os12g0525800 [Oryza sativa Japonica Group]|uniref:Os12g0525800 protein n=1 Tax=Oryza sativa subsp. japonica TaxID=39947 RepID=Q0IMZ1_ORYSJ|nr:Os12g0525800 [Oryza sativa Japonica Group]|eukprot:NP_001066905.1 Os12g0525800 [Oryza sativa Japonica Group]